MKLFKYQQFLEGNLINENLDQAKKLMRDSELLKRVAEELRLVNDDLRSKKALSLNDFNEVDKNKIREKLKTTKIDPEMAKMAERNPEFTKIKDSLGPKYVGWLYAFTYFYFIEGMSMENLFTDNNSFFKRLIENQGFLDKMEKKFDHNFIDPNITNNSEVLTDNLDKLENLKKVKKVYDQLTPILKKAYNEAPKVHKEKFEEIAIALGEMGKGDAFQQEKLWKGFFGEMRTLEEDTVRNGKTYRKGEKLYFGPLFRYNTITEFIAAAQNYVKSSDNKTVMDFYDRVNECNNKYGKLGADTVFEGNGILILEIRSFQANQMLNGHTSHCIKDYINNWNEYIGNHDNKQYYIYNFNIPQYDRLSTIGITIKPKQEIRACHDKTDGSLSDTTIKNLLKKWEKEYNIEESLFKLLKPMTKEEIIKRKKAREAEKNIVKKGISIKEIEKCVKEDGADINKDNCVALLNAVEENDMEKCKVILELGGMPNFRTKSDAIINRSKNLDMIKLLVKYRAELTGEIFNNVCDKPETVKYCLEQGLDPNFDRFLPIRRCIKGSWESTNNIGKPYMESLKLLIEHGGQLVDDSKVQLLTAIECSRPEILEMIIDAGAKTGFKDILDYSLDSRKINDEKRIDMKNIIQKALKEKRVT